MNNELTRLRQEADAAEKRRRMAARRVTWLEQLLYQSVTGEQFESRNAELETAIAETRLLGLQALKAKAAYDTADIQARFGRAATT